MSSELYSQAFLWIEWAIGYFIARAMIVTGIIVFFVEAFGGQRAAYGRYNTKNTGLAAPIAWFLQEVPAFLVPLAFMLFGHFKFFEANGVVNVNAILLLYFMGHYFNR